MVTATDEDELAARIRKAEEENQEVDGDDDDDEQVGIKITTSPPLYLKRHFHFLAFKSPFKKMSTIPPPPPPPPRFSLNKLSLSKSTYSTLNF